MENNEELVTEVTENVEEQTTEEIVEESTEETIEEETKGKFYTDEEIDDLVQKKLGRQARKLKKDYDAKIAPYLEAESIINQGMGTSNITEASQSLKDFYEQKGIKIDDYKQSYSEDDVEILAKYEADSIIEAGFDEVVDEVERLTRKGVENMTPREKLVFQKIASYRQNEDQKKELASMGIEINDEFNEFSKKLNPTLSVKEKYEMYKQMKPKPKVSNPGSMKNTTIKDNGVKEFYTRDEALKFTKADFDKNPELYKAIENSMLKW